MRLGARLWASRYLALLTSTTSLARDAVVTAASPPADALSFDVQLELVATGLRLPTDVASPNDGTGRLFITEQAGRIRVLRNEAVLATPFLDISSLVGSAELEQGLFGLAFHPEFVQNSWFYVSYTDLLGDTVIARYSVSSDPDLADLNSGSVEGGLAVAPASFGIYAGALIGTDELTGQVWAIGPDGAASPVAIPDLPVGGDTGVESVGFVPPGFSGGFAYLADRGTPDNSFPGTDNVLRISSEVLSAAGVQAGDLLVATEGAGLTVAIRCEAACTSTLVAQGPPTSHIEGHIIFANLGPA